MSNDQRPTIEIVIRGPQGAGKSTVAAAIREMLAQADIAAAVVGDEEPAHVEAAIEHLRDLRGRPRVLISTATHVGTARRGDFAATVAHVRRLKREIEALERDLPVDAMIGDPTDHRRDIGIADAVLKALRSSGVVAGTDQAVIALAKEIVDAIDRIKRSA